MQEIVIREKGLYITDGEEPQKKVTQPPEHNSKNFLDQIYDFILTGENSQPAGFTIANAKTSVAAGDTLQIGSIKNMDGGGYVQSDDLTSDDLVFSTVPDKKTVVQNNTPMQKNESKKLNIPHIIFLIVVVVFIIIFLKGLFK